MDHFIAPGFPIQPMQLSRSATFADGYLAFTAKPESNQVREQQIFLKEPNTKIGIDALVLNSLKRLD